MQQSPTVDILSSALAKAQKAFKPLKKNAVNPFFAKANDPEKGRYSDLSAVIEATQEALNDNEIFVTQEVTTNFEHQSVAAKTKLMHSSGEWQEFDPLELPAKEFTAQGIGATITYTRRYSLSGALNIAPEPDDDGNEASGRTGTAPAQQSKPSTPAAKPSSSPRPAAKPQPATKTVEKKEEPKQEVKPEAPKTAEPEKSIHEKLTAKVKEIWNDQKVGANGAQLKDFVLKGTNAKTLNDLKPEEAEGAYNALAEAQEKGTLKSLLGVK